MHRQRLLSIHAILIAVLAMGHTFLATPTAQADPYSLELLAPDSLIGWDNGSQPPAGWSIADGELSGSQVSSPLTGGWTLGDFELRWQWLVTPGGTWKLSLPPVAFDGDTTGPSLEVFFREGDSCGTTVDGQRVLTAGGSVAATAGWHEAVVRRDGAMMAIEVDQKPMGKFLVPPAERFGIVWSFYHGNGRMRGLTLEEPAGMALLNGHDHENWESRKLSGWEFHDGELVMVNGARDYIRTQREYANFTLSLEYKMQRRGNSGIGIRTPKGHWPSGDGIELQLEDEPPGSPVTRSSTMGLYGNLEPFAKTDQSERWNRVVIKAEGSMVTAWMNGRMVQHANLSQLPELKNRPLSGWIGIQDHGAWIRVRNVNLLEAPSGRGMPVWYQRRPEHASKLVLGRLMNSQQLAVPDEIRGGISRHVVTEADVAGDAKKPIVVAELNGPGAIVGISTPKPDVRVALFIDDAAKPVLECAASELALHIPQIGPDRMPLTTWVGYARSAKLRVTNAAPGTYAIEYVTVPSSQPHSAGLASVARGLLPALSYRQQQFESGRHRQGDPLPRTNARMTIADGRASVESAEAGASSNEGLDAGQSRTLIDIQGAGVVQWTTLKVPPGVLMSDDLWLEYYVDGEEQPAITAPARYLYAGLQQRRGFNNFVMLESEGACSFLAMPFSNGLRIVAKNTGSSPINSVRMTASVEPALDDAARRAVAASHRLRGKFVPACDSEDCGPLVQLDGNGRLIGLIAAAAKKNEEGGGDAALGFESLTVDGAPQAAWSGMTMDELAGVAGSSGDVRLGFGGRLRDLTWRYLLTAPVEFRNSLVLVAPKTLKPGSRLALYYLQPGSAAK